MFYETKTLELNNQYVNDQKINIEVIYEYIPPEQGYRGEHEPAQITIIDIIALSTGNSVLDIMDLVEHELIQQEVKNYETANSYPFTL